jgi:hypothetical protein
VRVRVFRVSDGRRVAATEYAVPAAQLPGLEAQVAAAAAAHVHGRPLTAAELDAVREDRAPRRPRTIRTCSGRRSPMRRTPDALGRAAASFAQARELDPGPRRGACSRGERVRRARRARVGAGAPQLLVRHAYAHATKATAVDPSLALGWATLARVAGLEVGLPVAGAARAAERAVALAPRDAEALYGAARAHWNAGNVAAAEPLFVRAQRSTRAARRRSSTSPTHGPAGATGWARARP